MMQKKNIGEKRTNFLQKKRYKIKMELQITLTHQDKVDIAMIVVNELRPDLTPDKIISREEAMKILGCIPNTISTYIKRGKLHPVGEKRRNMEFSYKEVINLKKAQGE